jgi:hypothetical protein
MLRTGRELKEFTVSRPKARENERGREIIDGCDGLGALKAVLAQAKPEEIERWRQLSHPVTHKIIMAYRPAFEVLPGDVLIQKDTSAGQTRKFYVQALPYDPGGLGHFTVFYCDERTDVT